MPSVPFRSARRPGVSRGMPLLATSLAVGVLAAAALSPAWVTATPAATPVALAASEPVREPGDGEPGGETPTGEPTPTETESTAPPTVAPPVETTAPTPTESVPTDPQTTAPAPTTAPPVDPAPTLPPPVQPGQPGTGQPGLGVRITTGDVVLTNTYWNAAETVVALQLTIANTSGVPERVQLGYTLPAGLTDGGTPGCSAVGGGEHRCGAWATAPGARFSSSIRVRVDADAWQRMPLSGTVRVTATGPAGSTPVSDDEGFAVLFPAGPPVAGIALDADQVSFDISGTASTLAVRLGNTGKVDATGTVEVILPDGVTVPAPPAGCQPSGPTRTRCELGALAAGRTTTVRLPVAATPEAQRSAPLAGAVVGELAPRSGDPRRVQMSFKITAAAALATPTAAVPAPTGSQGVLAGAGQGAGSGDRFGSVQQTAIILIVVSGLLVVLALTLATTSLRRRLSGRPAKPAATSNGLK